MSELSPQAQEIWNTYLEGYSEALCTPIEQFDTSADCYSRKILASVLREVVEQCIPMKNIWGTSTMVPKLDPEVSRRMILDIAAELEQL